MPAGAGVVTIGKRKVWIETEPKLHDAWQTAVNWRKFPERRTDYLAVGDFLYELAADLIRGTGKVGRHSSQAFTIFLVTRVLGISSSATRVRTIGARGIVVGGMVATEARITGNTVRDVIQGIHVGISTKRQRNPGPGQGVADTAGRVIIAGNTAHIVLMPESAFERHGIFVGNCQSLLIQDNFSTCDRVSTAARLAIDGIRVYGFLGPFAYITRNHLSGFTTGIRVAALNNTSDGPSSMWRVVDNIAVGAAHPVDQSLKTGTATSVTPTGNMP